MRFFSNSFMSYAWNLTPEIMIQYQNQEKKFNIKAHFSLFIHDQDLTFQ